jgi:asparagine synthase (glutamine-hydrolysing)
LAVAASADRLLPVGFKGRNWLHGLGADMNTGLPQVTACFDLTARHRLMSGNRDWSFVAEGVRESRVPDTAGLLDRATRMDFENYLAEDILVKVDRASMLNSLEVRAPFLDYRIVEFAFGRVPAELKATRSSRKILLKKLCARVLPPEFDRQRKQGFSIPLGSWLQRGPWRDFFADILLSATDSPFNRAFISKLIQDQARGRANSERLFALTLFELWRREYRVSF